MIENGMHRIEPEGIDVKLSNPLESVFNKIVPHLVAIRTIEVERRPPRCFVALCKIRAKVPKVVPLRSKVVVHHIEDHGHPAIMAGIDEAFKSRWPSVRTLHSEGINTVISPISSTGERGD